MAGRLQRGCGGDCDLTDLPERADKLQDEATLAEAVTEYVKKHPQSMDTAEGIAEWWIPSGGNCVNLQALRRVLEKMTEQGILDRVGSGEYAHYRARRE